MENLKTKTKQVGKEIGFPLFLTIFFIYGEVFTIEVGVAMLVSFFFFSLTMSYIHDFIKEKLGREKYAKFCTKAPKIALVIVVFLFCLGVFYQIKDWF